MSFENSDINNRFKCLGRGDNLKEYIRLGEEGISTTFNSIQEEIKWINIECTYFLNGHTVKAGFHIIARSRKGSQKKCQFSCDHMKTG